MSVARLLAGASLLWAAQAGAHADLVGSSPPDGARLARAPESVELRFNEPVKALSLRLAGGAGKPAVLPAPPAAAEVLRVTLPAGLGDGQYALSFRVISLDSHPVSGSIAFSVGDAGAAPARTAELDTQRGWRVALRAVRDFSLLAAAGGALFLLFVGRFPGERRILVCSAALATVAAILGTSLQGAALLGLEAEPWGQEAWRAGIRSSFGTSAGVAVAGALLIGAGALAGGRVRSILLAVGALTAIASFPMTGHAASARLGVLGPFALVVHALAAAFWLGSLCALLAGLSSVALRRFSRLGIVAVALLVGGGVGFALLQLRSLGDVTGSEYGRLILGKVMLLAGLLVAASLNRYRFLPRLERGDAGAAGRLRASIAGEIALVVCVIALTAILVQTPPPRDDGFRQTLQAAGRFAELSVSPARAGRNTVAVRFQDTDPAEVVLGLSNPQAGLEPVARPMRRETAGHYTWDGAELMMTGTWTIEIQARIGDFDRVVFRAELPVLK